MAEPLIPIIQKAFEFNVALYGYINKFPHAHKALVIDVRDQLSAVSSFELGYCGRRADDV